MGAWTWHFRLGQWLEINWLAHCFDSVLLAPQKPDARFELVSTWSWLFAFLVFLKRVFAVLLFMCKRVAGSHCWHTVVQIVQRLILNRVCARTGVRLWKIREALSHLLPSSVLFTCTVSIVFLDAAL